MASHIAAVFILALAFLAAGIDTYAATLVVTKTADTADGICDSDCSLREAVAAAASGDTVVFSPLFNEPQTITLSLGPVLINKSLIVMGPGATLLAISGNQTDRILRISAGLTVSLDGITLKHGKATFQDVPGGGAIVLVQSALTLTNMVITENSAPVGSQAWGGGIYSDRGTLTIENSTINNNVGSGIRAFASATTIRTSTISNNQNQGVHGGGTVSLTNSLSVSDSSVTNNTGAGIANGSGPVSVVRCIVRSNGSGISADSSSETFMIDQSVISDSHPGRGVDSRVANTIITRTTIDNNFANGIGAIGGGVYSTGTTFILDSSVTNNRAFESGGGIYTDNGHLYLTNSTLSGNRADNGSGTCNCPGGGLHIRGSSKGGGTVTVTNSTITNNWAAGRGGGVRNDTGGSMTVRNSIVGGNTSFTAEKDLSGISQSAGFNLVGNTTGSTGWVESDALNTDPVLAPLGINGGPTRSHALLPGSPAINAGSNELARDPFDNSVLAFDQRGIGYARLVNGNVDIGAYEANYATGPVNVGGRVFVDASGRSVSKAYVSLTDGLGNIRYTQTNPFGYFKFQGLLPGTSHTVRVLHKSYQFDSPQVVTIDQPRDNLDFVALGH